MLSLTVKELRGSPSLNFSRKRTSSDPMEDPMHQRIRKWNRTYWVGWIWLIGFLGMMAEDVASGIMSLKRLPDGLIGSAIGSPFMLFVTIPVGALGLLIGSWRPFRRFQIHLSLLLPTLLCAISPVSIAWDRVFPGERFERFTGVAFPTDVKVENTTYDFGFGPFADRGYEFLFTCTAEETERLTRELKLDRTDADRTLYGAPGVGSPDPEGGWIIEEIWTAPDRVGNAHYLQLHTDATRTRVRISCGTI
jgi:hypothetical protein